MAISKTGPQLRNEARAYIQKFDGMDRPYQAFEYLRVRAMSPMYRFTGTQLGFIAQGLQLGMSEGVR